MQQVRLQTDFPKATTNKQTKPLYITNKANNSKCNWNPHTPPITFAKLLLSNFLLQSQQMKTPPFFFSLTGLASPGDAVPGTAAGMAAEAVLSKEGCLDLSAFWFPLDLLWLLMDFLGGQFKFALKLLETLGSVALVGSKVFPRRLFWLAHGATSWFIERFLALPRIHHTS